MLRWIGLLWLILPMTPVVAESYYLQLMEQAEISGEKLQQAVEQLQAYEPVQLQEVNGLQPFHRRAQPEETQLQPLCRNCHLRLPHRSSERKRTFLNMHSRFIACETCHLRPGRVTFSYRWLAYDGPHAGIEVMPVGPGDTQDEPPFIPQPGARIVPFLENNPLVVFKDDTAFEDLMQRWEAGDDMDRARLKARLHAPLQPEGPECEGCHSGDRMLDLQRLGATPAQVQAIEQNSIARFLSRFKDEKDRLRITDLLR